jgi:rare lipoprotein A
MKNFYASVFLSFLILPLFAQVQTGKASFYADKFEGVFTASGEKYRHNKLTGAHKTLPFGTKVRVTNLENDKSVEVVINDRGP